MKRKIIAAAVVLAFIGVPVAVKLSKNKTVKEAELAKVELRQIQPTILASGNLVFRQEVQLSSEVIGKVSEVLVKEGDKIERGQVLLRLDPTPTAPKWRSRTPAGAVLRFRSSAPS
ncbi:biotin/lipoyl-binding protein [Massilia sp. RP-1-19]|uniref:Biotin/lipoyl-binding protein n=1 Tax=Massilia polaris TaxID=2728846 RepID=A0A848HML0_9BURK|nr:biotin/lipoyl-binding protein [Massilia polaris]NML62454.1 biotin/lipoyl-binding protein [Massilia polaris]